MDCERPRLCPGSLTLPIIKPSSCPYSPECLEEKFSEVPHSPGPTPMSVPD
jgi:hypothetical protein